MAAQNTKSAQKIEFNSLAAVAGLASTSPGTSLVSTSGETNGSSHHLNGTTLHGHDPYTRAKTGFCYRWPLLGDNITDESDDKYTVDIVTVPAVGGNPMHTWYLPPKDSHSTHPDTPKGVKEVLAGIGQRTTAQSVSPSSFGRPWIIFDLSAKIETARILVYSHGQPEKSSTIDTLSTNLLHKILEERKSVEASKRPLFFLCHSTGGIIVKHALIKAQGHSLYDVVGENCYGVAFFATPHQGSSYLSSPLYSDTIERAMGLEWPIPTSFQKQLKIKAEILVEMARTWMPVAAELKLWTFYETIDTDLTDAKVPKNERVSFKAPITSIKSAILELHHEIDRPIQACHADCAAFGPEDEYTKWKFIEKLREAALQAQKLSRKKHVPIGLEQKVDVEIHGFYENRDPVATGKTQKRDIRLWSTINPLENFLKHGPAECLNIRLQEKDVPPARAQMISSSSSRRLSFIQPIQPTNVTANRSTAQNQKPQKSKGKQSATSNVLPAQNILGRMKDTAVVAGAGEALQRVLSRPSIGTKSSSQSSSTAVVGSSMISGPKLEESTTATPSVLVSEHPVDTDKAPSLPAPSAINQNDTASIRAETEPRPQTEHISASNGSRVAGISLNSPSKLVNVSSTTRTDRLSPGSRPPRPSAQQVLPSPAEDQESDEGGTESNGGETSTAGPLTRPDPQSQKFIWIHLAFNNPKWVSDIFSAIERERKEPFNETLLQDTVWCKRHIRGRNTHYHACFVKPGCVFINPMLNPPSDPPMPSPLPPMEIKMSMYLPYLHWDTYRRMIKRRDFVKRRLEQGRARPAPNIETEDLELIVAWQYLGYDPPFHTRRTLDQFGYPNLSDTRARDDDQMLYKITKNYPQNKEEMPTQNSAPTSNGNKDSKHDDVDEDTSNLKEDPYLKLKDGKVLMIDQVWLWIVDSATVVTFFPKRQSLSLEGKLYQQADLRNSIYNEVNADLSRRCESSLDLAALVALHSVTLLFDRASHRDLEIFRIFEAALSILIEKLTESFKYFRAKGFQAVADDDDSDDDADAIREQHKKEGKRFQNQVRQNVSALLELRDISDELQTLKKLFEQQKEAINKMLEIYEHCGYHEINGCEFLHEAQQKLKDYLHRIEEMAQSAHRTGEDFRKLLDLVQRQANVDEARRSRWSADLQTIQSRAIFIFTVFTVFFLPLSFFTGVFGMNTSEWAGTGGTGGKMVSLWTIAETSLPLSFAIFIGALTLALSTPVWRRAKYVVQFPFHPFEPADDGSLGEETDTKPTNSKKGRRFRRFKKVKKVEDYHERDFWEANLITKEDKYQIPEQNLQSGDQTSRKQESWRSHKSWSFRRTEKRGQDKTSRTDPLRDFP